MNSMLDYIKELLGFRAPRIYEKPSPRKRPLLDDSDYSLFKIRRLSSSTMHHNSFERDGPSTSNSIFKKPSKQRTSFYQQKPQVIEIDLSDDEDIVDLTRSRERLSNGNWIDTKIESRPSCKPWQSKNSHQTIDSPATVLRKGKASICNGRRVLSSLNRGSALNTSFRMEEKLRYREILKHTAPSASSYCSSIDDSFYSTGTSLDKNLYSNSRTRKILSLIKDKPTQTIDLTENGTSNNVSITIKDSSDSEPEIVAVRNKIEPVNTMKKLLNTEPITRDDWLQKWDERKKITTNQQERLILEEKHKRDKFREANSLNLHEYIEAKVRNCLKITDIIEPIEDVCEVPVLPKLTKSQQEMIDDALRSEPKSQVLIEKFNMRITRADISTLKGLNWLNDEVINYYVNLLMERGQLPDMPKVHAMNTFFYPKLISSGYSSLRRWTKRVDIFAQDYLLVPIHLGVHWCMSIINFREKTIKYYDSMGGNNQKCIEALSKYLREEHSDKKKQPFDETGWSKVIVKHIPQQMNGSDCGMFSCMYAEFITRNAKITFTQEHMPYFRRKMVLEIITGKLLINRKG